MTTFINDLFYLDIESEICNYADDTTIYACDKSIDTVIVKLEDKLQKILNWFNENGMCANPAKFQILQSVMITVQLIVKYIVFYKELQIYEGFNWLMVL